MNDTIEIETNEAERKETQAALRAELNRLAGHCVYCGHTAEEHFEESPCACSICDDNTCWGFVPDFM